MRFNIINLTGLDLALTDMDASGMSKWRDTIVRQIPAGEKKLFGAKFGLCGSGRAHATYSLGDINNALELRAHGGQITVRWNLEIQQEKVWVYPPPTETGWTFKAKSSSAIYSVVLAQMDDLPEQQVVASCEALRSQWMKAFYPVLKDRAVGSLFYAATHDSASYSMANCFCGCFAKTQSLTIEGQLNQGARMLDFRVGDLGPDAKDERFVFVHDACLTKVSVRNGLNQVRRFVERNPSEVVFLGFHRLLGRTKAGFDFNGLSQMVLEAFNGPHGNYLLPEAFAHKTYEQILEQTEQTQRVVVCWPRVDEGRVPEFWQKVRHHWDHQTVGRIKKNREYLQKAHCEEIAPYPFHSDQAVIFSIFKGPCKLSPYIQNLYEVDGEMANKVEFVAVDFIECTWLVDICIGENLVRAKRCICQC